MTNKIKGKIEKKKLDLKIESRSKLRKINSEELLKECSSVYDRRALKAAHKYLSCEIKNKFKTKMKGSCRTENATEARTDLQVKLRCRQLPEVVHELRKAILRQDWYETATLVMVLCHPGLTLYNTLIIKTCFVLLFNHPNSTYELLESFVRLVTGYILDEDIKKFIKILFIIRTTELSPLERGKYVRKESDYKVTRDPLFEKLQ